MIKHIDSLTVQNVTAPIDATQRSLGQFGGFTSFGPDDCCVAARYARNSVDTPGRGS